jgi:hypothetical protein
MLPRVPQLLARASRMRQAKCVRTLTTATSLRAATIASRAVSTRAQVPTTTTTTTTSSVSECDLKLSPSQLKAVSTLHASWMKAAQTRVLPGTVLLSQPRVNFTRSMHTSRTARAAGSNGSNDSVCILLYHALIL